ncbi:MAG: hypothetical protein ACRC92_05320 [Peptostreptococcaceae bacterium]
MKKIDNLVSVNNKVVENKLQELLGELLLAYEKGMNIDELQLSNNRPKKISNLMNI